MATVQKPRGGGGGGRKHDNGKDRRESFTEVGGIVGVCVPRRAPSCRPAQRTVQHFAVACLQEGPPEDVQPWKNPFRPTCAWPPKDNNFVQDVSATRPPRCPASCGAPPKHTCMQ